MWGLVGQSGDTYFNTNTIFDKLYVCTLIRLYVCKFRIMGGGVVVDIWGGVVDIISCGSGGGGGIVWGIGYGYKDICMDVRMYGHMDIRM